jgi:hypothetical protein
MAHIEVVCHIQKLRNHDFKPIRVHTLKQCVHFIEQYIMQGNQCFIAHRFRPPHLDCCGQKEALVNISTEESNIFE